MPAIAEPGADQPDLPPVYVGPTPANPFGGHTFDIFDVMERAEETAAAAEPSRQEMLAPAVMPAGVEPVIIETEPLPAQAEATGAELVFEPLPEPVLAPEPQPEPEPPVAANDAAPEPAIKPIIIGAE